MISVEEFSERVLRMLDAFPEYKHEFYLIGYTVEFYKQVEKIMERQGISHMVENDYLSVFKDGNPKDILTYDFFVFNKLENLPKEMEIGDYHMVGANPHPPRKLENTPTYENRAVPEIQRKILDTIFGREWTKHITLLYTYKEVFRLTNKEKLL